MTTLFETMPGLEIPVAEIGRILADMWQGDPVQGHEAPSEFRASQMNLILHFGLRTTTEAARQQFATAIRFSQRYPCRVIVLCPEDGSGEAPPLRSKVFSECYIGSSRREMSCCEVLIFGYPVTERGFLENQISVSIEADLPVYYWVHGFADRQRVGEFQYLLRIAQRIVFDSALEEDVRREVALPKQENVRDLAYARLLPVRQAIGQFLSAYQPADLTESLRQVSVRHAPASRAEGAALLGWMRERLLRSGAESSVEFLTEAASEEGLAVRFAFAGERTFSWEGNFRTGQAHIEADFGRGRDQGSATARLLNPEMALAEALFF